jgi:hypothetical protein
LSELGKKVYNYETRTRTLEEVAKLLNLALDIKLLRGSKYVWQVKLEKLRLHNQDFAKYGDNITRKYVICRADNPNSAMSRLCEKISYRTVVAPQIEGGDKIITLGLVQRGPLYLRVHYEGEI